MGYTRNHWILVVIRIAYFTVMVRVGLGLHLDGVDGCVLTGVCLTVTIMRRQRPRETYALC